MGSRLEDARRSQASAVLFPYQILLRGRRKARCNSTTRMRPLTPQPSEAWALISESCRTHERTLLQPPYEQRAACNPVPTSGPVTIRGESTSNVEMTRERKERVSGNHMPKYSSALSFWRPGATEAEEGSVGIRDRVSRPPQGGRKPGGSQWTLA